MLDCPASDQGVQTAMRSLILAAVAVVSIVGAARAQVDLPGPNGTTFTVRDAGGGQLTAPAVFADWPRLCVRACVNCDAPCAAGEIYDAGGAASVAELNGLQRALAPIPLAGLTVQRKVFVPNGGPANANGFIRYLDLLSNGGAEPITVAVRFGSVAPGGGTLQPGAERVWRTRDDDADLEVGDRWLVTDDDDAFGGAHAVGHLVFGSGARFTPARVAQRFPDPNAASSMAWEYREVTVGPGETVAFLSILVAEPIRQDAIVEVDHLLRAEPVDALFGLTPAERTAIANFDVDPANAAPIADAGGPYTANEGEQIQVSAVGSFDVESVNLQYAWDFDDDGEFDDAIGSNTALVAFPDDGVFVLRVRVTDQMGKSDIDSARVNVRNVAPRIDAVNTDSPIVEGGVLTVDVLTTEQGQDALTYDFDWDGDGTFEEPGVAASRWQHLYAADGVYQARVRVNDDDGGQMVQGFEVRVTNAAPEIRDIVANSPTGEGSPVNIQVVAVDPGGDRITYAFDLDDDGEFEIEGPDAMVQTSFPDDDGGRDGSGLYTITVRVTDDAGATTEREHEISIRNARPTITVITHTGPVMEGEAVTIDVVATDPGTDELTYSFDLDNDGDFQDDIVDQADPFAQAVFRQQGEYVVGVRVRDDDGGIAFGSTMITVTNAPPTAELTGPAFANEGQTFEVTCVATEPGDDALSYDFDLDGDGAFEVTDSPNPTRSTSFRQEGQFTLQCRVSDGDATATAMRNVRIGNVRPELTIEVDSPQNEGAEVVVRALAEDAGGDELTFSYDFDNDGVFEIEGSAEPVARHAYPDQGTYTIRVVVDDGAELIAGLALVQILNVAPALSVDATTPVNEGDDLVITVDVTDPGDDVVTLRWDTDGDGEPDFEGPVEGPEDLVRTITAPDDARFSITVWADDGEGGEAEAQTAVVITNLPPRFLDIAVILEAVEGQPYNLVMPATDPAGANDPLTFALFDPPPGVDIEANTGRLLWTPTYQQYLDSPIHLVVQITDGDGGSAQTEIDVPVLAADVDMDGLPDTWEAGICDAMGNCLSGDDPDDATADPDGDGRDTLTEWMEGTDPFGYEGPERPTLVEPADGLRVPTRAPELVVAPIANGLDEDVLVVFALHTDGDPEDVVVQSEPMVQPAEGPTTWAPPEGALEEDVWYGWRARATSGAAETDWSASWRFRTNAENTAPTAPTPRAPVDGALVDSRRPALSVLPSMDADDDALRYVFRLYRGEGEEAVPVGGGGEGIERDGFVEFVPMADLIENAVVSWDVIAEDEAGEKSAPSERWSLTVDTANSAPDTPDITYPADRSVVDALKPVFVACCSVDDDDTMVGYVFTLRLSDGENDLVETSEPVIVAEGEDATWTPSEELVEDTAYLLDVFAQDDDGTVSESIGVRFFVSVQDDPPPTPTPTSPADGAKVRKDQAIVTWMKVEDPEGADVAYVITYCDDTNACADTPPQRQTGYNLGRDVIAGGKYTWQVRAVDETGNQSPPSEPRGFTVERETTGGDDGGEGCDCRADGGAPSPAGWALLLIGLVGLRRRRR